MSFPSLDDADEFGGLDHLVPPGQDPELLHGLVAAFTAQLKPANFIERMWVRDMAIQMARIEYVRMADCAVHRHVQESAAPADADSSGEGGSASEPPDRAVGKAFAAHLALFNDLILLEHEMIRERDRLIRQYDDRTGIVKAYKDAMALIKELQTAPGNG